MKIGQNHEGYLMVFIENQTIAFLTPKMKTSTIVYINSKCFYEFRATANFISARL